MDGDFASDGQLIGKARRGDEAAFLDLYRRYRRPVFQFAWRLTGSQPNAEDVTQESFLALLENDSYQPSNGSLRAYLLGIARHLSLRKLRASGRETGEEPDADSPAPGQDALESLLASERADILGRAVASLPIGQREVLVLFEYEDLSLEEIGRIIGLDPNAVKARLFRARESLRKRLAPLLAASAERTSR